MRQSNHQSVVSDLSMARVEGLQRVGIMSSRNHSMSLMWALVLQKQWVWTTETFPVRLYQGVTGETKFDNGTERSEIQATRPSSSQGRPCKLEDSSQRTARLNDHTVGTQQRFCSVR